MTFAQVQEMQETIAAAWEVAAKEHGTPDIRFLYASKEPYITP